MCDKGEPTSVTGTVLLHHCAPTWYVLDVFRVTCTENTPAAYTANVVVVVAYEIPGAPAYIRRLADGSSPTQGSLALLLTNIIAGGGTIATQLLASGLIGFTAWSHWREIKEFVHTSVATGGLSRSIVTMALLVESGIVYTCIWVCNNQRRPLLEVERQPDRIRSHHE